MGATLGRSPRGPETAPSTPSSCRHHPRSRMRSPLCLAWQPWRLRGLSPGRPQGTAPVPFLSGSSCSLPDLQQVSLEEATRHAQWPTATRLGRSRRGPGTRLSPALAAASADGFSLLWGLCPRLLRTIQVDPAREARGGRALGNSGRCQEEAGGPVQRLTSWAFWTPTGPPAKTLPSRPPGLLCSGPSRQGVHEARQPRELEPHECPGGGCGAAGTYPGHRPTRIRLRVSVPVATWELQAIRLMVFAETERPFRTECPLSCPPAVATRVWRRGPGGHADDLC